MATRTTSLNSSPTGHARELVLAPPVNAAQTAQHALERGRDLSAKIEGQFAEANKSPRVTREAVSDLMALCHAAADQYELAQSLSRNPRVTKPTGEPLSAMTVAPRTRTTGTTATLAAA